MRFSDLVCILHFGDDAEFEQEHDRDENGRFSSSRLLKGTKSKSEFKREHKAKTVEEFYGEEIKGRGLTGRRAVSRLVQEQRGHIKAAFHRDGMGDIDLVWGDMQAGLCHVFARRLENKQDVQKVINNIANTIANGKRNYEKEDDRNFVIEHGTMRVMVTKSFKENNRLRLMVSAYEPTPDRE